MINKIFCLSKDEYRDILGSFQPHHAEEIMEARHKIGISLAKAAGLPCGEHDQVPYDLIYLFPLSLSPDAYDGFDNLAGTMTDREEHECVVSLFFVWAVQALRYFKILQYDKAMRKIKLMSIRLSRRWDGQELPESCSYWFDWFESGLSR